LHGGLLETHLPFFPFQAVASWFTVSRAGASVAFEGPNIRSVEGGGKATNPAGDRNYIDCSSRSMPFP